MDQPPLDETFDAQTENVTRASEAIREVVDALKKLPRVPDVEGQPLHHPFRACKKFYTKLKIVESRFHEAAILVLEMQFNAYWFGKLKKRYDLKDYEKKKQVAKEINGDLRHYGYAILHPESGSPCLVLAVGSPDGAGRYVLADRLTKKRSHTSSTLLELFPIRLVPEPRRRESFLEMDGPQAGGE